MDNLTAKDLKTGDVILTKYLVLLVLQVEEEYKEYRRLHVLKVKSIYYAIENTTPEIYTCSISVNDDKRNFHTILRAQ